MAAAGSALHGVARLVMAPWPLSVAGFAAIMLIGALAPVLQIAATGRIVERLTSPGALPQPAANLTAAVAGYMPWIALLVGALILSFTINNNIFQPYFAALHTARIVALWQRRLLLKATRLRLEQLERPEYYDQLQRARAALDWPTIAGNHSQLQRILARSAGCVGILWVFASVHWSLALVLAAGGWWLTRWRIRRGRDMIRLRLEQTPQRRRQNYWRDLLTQRPAAAEVRLFGLDRHLVRRWREASRQLLAQLGAARRQNFRRELPVAAAHTALYGLVGLGLLYAAWSGRIGAGALVALLFGLQQYLELLGNFSRLDRLQTALSELGYVEQFCRLDGDEAESGLPAPHLERDGIRFEQVSFQYPGTERAVLSEINLHIRSGERIALVGENGAGKTTLTRLLLGLYQPTAGRVLFEGVDVRELDPVSLRRQCAAVFQETPHYALTVSETIGLGDLARGGDHAAIEAAAARSGLDATVDGLPRGFATVLAKEFDGGVDLSGGQWQKLAIARAYLRDAALLVLDEPAAALDPIAEWELYRSFMGLAASKTVVLISHRLGSARLADRIVFLQNGRIAQCGSHDELLRQGGPYAELYRLQAAWYQEVDADAPPA